jgi:nucleotide sugar dehydrogenase
LVLVETTVPPGTCQKIVKPIIEGCLQSRKLPLDKIKIGHSYERVMPGPNYVDSIQNFYRVYSGVDDKSKAATEQFLKTVISTDQYPLTLLESTNATEMAKVLENSYRAMNIGFIVEWSRFAEEANVNLYEVVNAIRMRPTHKNMMLPGIGVGGYCLTKDPLLASWARQNLFDSPFGLTQSENGVRTNDQMPYYAFQYLKASYARSLRGANVLLLGVSYLSDVGDTRYTPVETFYDCLTMEGAHVSLHDPYVGFWDEKQLRVSNDLDGLLRTGYDVIVVSTGHSIYKKNTALIDSLCKWSAGALVLDTIGVFGTEEIGALAKHVQVKVLGRGDL